MCMVDTMVIELDVDVDPTVREAGAVEHAGAKDTIGNGGKCVCLIGIQKSKHYERELGGAECRRVPPHPYISDNRIPYPLSLWSKQIRIHDLIKFTTDEVDHRHKFDNIAITVSSTRSSTETVTKKM
ncbi:hypothetical protein JHK82_032908 [Glycine max]|nr:hypothetical protein JHK86_032995 [Glycine max]KAG5118488.1 hypothetical protein JHK82_032908 [Glycine max]